MTHQAAFPKPGSVATATLTAGLDLTQYRNAPPGPPIHVGDPAQAGSYTLYDPAWFEGHPIDPDATSAVPGSIKADVLTWSGVAVFVIGLLTVGRTTAQQLRRHFWR